MSHAGPILALLLLVACADDGTGGPGPAPDAGSPADTGVAAGPLRVASWNLREFPLTPGAVSGAAEILDGLDLDVVLLIEVENRVAFEQLAFDLPDFEAVLFERDGTPMGTAGLFRRGRVTRVSDELLFAGEAAFPRPAVHLELDTGGAVPLTVIAVHLEAGTEAADEMQRATSIVRLEDWVRARVDGPEADAVLVIGDYNEAFSDPMAATVFAPLLDAARYSFLTDELQAMGVATYLPADIVLDHAVATTAAPAATVTVPPLDETVTGYESTISDHLPLVVELATP